MIPLEGNFSVLATIYMHSICTDSYFMLSFSLLRFHAMSSHSGSSVKDVLNKEELSSQEERVHAKAPQIFSNGCSVAAETVTTVKANTQNREFEIWLTFAWQYV